MKDIYTVRTHAIRTYDRILSDTDIKQAQDPHPEQ